MTGLLLTVSFSLAVLSCAWFWTRRESVYLRGSTQLVLAVLLLGMLLPAAAIQSLQQWLGSLWEGVGAGPSSGLAAVAAHLTLFTLAALLIGRLRHGLGSLVVAGFLAGLSLMTEVMQTFSPGRHPSLADVATNLAGIALGLAAVRLVEHRTRRSDRQSGE